MKRNTLQRGVAAIACALFVLFASFQSVFAAETNSSVNGRVTTGLLFDDTVTQEMKDGMLAEGRTIIKTEKGEMMLIPADPFTLELISKDNNHVYKTVTSTQGDYDLESVEAGDYTLNLKIEDENFYTEEIHVEGQTTHNLIVNLDLDKFVEGTMHSVEDDSQHTEEASGEEPVTLENPTVTDGSSENATTDEENAYSHKSPHLPCLDYNGPNAPDTKHVHNWAHFYLSDCFLSFYARCSTDHVDKYEFCDGTRNCSTRISHSKYFHKH